MSNEQNDLIEKLSYFTKINKDKLHVFLKSNNLQTLIDHPETIKPTLNQLESINKLRELNNLYRRLSKYKEYQFKDSKDIVEFLDTQYPNKYDKEQFIVAYLDKDNKLLSCETISTGTLNASIVHPRDVLKQALKHNSNKLILSHNHPSGNPKPSKEDIKITIRLMEAAKLLDIEIIDHIIVGQNNHYSLKENGHLNKEIQLKSVNLEYANNNRHKLIYKKDIEKTINLTNKFTKIPKTELNNILKKVDFKTFINNPDKYIKNENQLNQLNKLKFLNEAYKDIIYKIDKIKISGPDCLTDYINEKYTNLEDKDYNIVTYLNTKNEVIKSFIIPDDLTTEKEFNYIFENAILYDSSSFIITSKSNKEISPTNDTIDKINELKEKSDIVGIRLLDNIDIGINRSISYRQEGLLEDKGAYELKNKKALVNVLNDENMDIWEHEDEWEMEV